MKSHIILLAALACAGCAHNVVPPATPFAPVEQATYPALPPSPAYDAVRGTTPHCIKPSCESEQPMVEVQHLPDPPIPQVEQCGELTVHLGKLDVNMPHGGSIEVAGVKGETKAYHILIEDVTFTHKDTCLR